MFAVLTGLLFSPLVPTVAKSHFAIQRIRVIKSKRKIDEMAGRAAFGCWAEETCAGDGVRGVLAPLFTADSLFDV